MVLLVKCITRVFCNAWKPVGWDRVAASPATALGPLLGEVFLARVG